MTVPPPYEDGTPRAGAQGGADPSRRALQHAREDAPRRIRERAAARRQSPRRHGALTTAGAALLNLLREHGIDLAPPALPGLDWSDFLGPEVAEHLYPVGFDSQTGTLSLQADSRVWHTQARLLQETLTARLQELGHPVTSIALMPPGTTAPSSRPTPLRTPQASGTNRPVSRFLPAASSDPLIEAAVQRQRRSVPREPDPVPAPLDQPRPPHSTRHTARVLAVYKARRARSRS